MSVVNQLIIHPPNHRPQESKKKSCCARYLTYWEVSQSSRSLFWTVLETRSTRVHDILTRPISCVQDKWNYVDWTQIALALTVQIMWFTMYTDILVNVSVSSYTPHATHSLVHSLTHSLTHSRHTTAFQRNMAPSSPCTLLAAYPKCPCDRLAGQAPRPQQTQHDHRGGQPRFVPTDIRPGNAPTHTELTPLPI